MIRDIKPYAWIPISNDFTMWNYECMSVSFVTLVLHTKVKRVIQPDNKTGMGERGITVYEESLKLVPPKFLWTVRGETSFCVIQDAAFMVLKTSHYRPAAGTTGGSGRALLPTADCPAAARFPVNHCQIPERKEKS